MAEVKDPNKNLKKVYSKLKEINPDFKVSEEKFYSDMESPDNALKVHKYLSKNVNGFKVDESRFMEDMGLKKKATETASSPTSSEEPFDPIANRKEKYDAQITEMLQNDEVIQSRKENIIQDFQSRFNDGELSQEEANKELQLALLNDEKIKERELSIAQEVDKEFKADIKAIEKMQGAKDDLDKASVAESSISNLNRNFYGLGADLLDALGIGAKFINNYATEPLGLEEKVESVEDTPAGSIAKKYRETLNEITPAADENTENKIVQVSGALGQVLSLAASGGAGNAAKVANLNKAIQTQSGVKQAVQGVIKATNNRTSQIASAQMSSYGYKRAVDEGATEGEAFASAFTSGLIGKTEALPIGKAFQRLDKATGGTVKRMITGGFKGGAEELAQESLQTYLENLSAQQIYDSKEELTSGVLESGEIGGYTGFIFNSLLAAMTKRKARATSPKDKAQLEQVETELKDVQAEIEANKKQAEVNALEKAEAIENDNQQEPAGPDNTQDAESTAIGDTASEATQPGTPASEQDAAPTQQQSADGDVQADPINQSREGETKVTPIEQETTESAIFESQTEAKPIQKNEDGSYTFKNKKNQYNLKNEGGALKIVNETEGKEIPKYVKDKDGKNQYNRQYSRVRQEYESEVDFNEGVRSSEVNPQEIDANIDEAGLNELMADKDNFVATYSQNPQEIALQYRESRKEQASKLPYKEQMIAENLGKVPGDSFNSFGDRNVTGKSLAKSYFKKDGLPIDVQAQIISETSGTEVTPQDIVDFMVKYPNGAQSAISKRTTVQIEMENKFQELTGLTLNSRTIDLVESKQQAQQLSESTQQKIEKEGITPDNIDDIIAELEPNENAPTPQEYEQWKEYAKQKAKSKSEGSPSPTETQARNEANEGRTEGKSETRKKLDKKLETGKTKESQYAQRRLSDVKDKSWAREQVEDNKSYRESSVKKANTESDKMIADFKKELGEKEGLKALVKMFNDGEIPPIMEFVLADKLDIELQLQGMRSERLEFFKNVKEKKSDWGKRGRGMQSDASPEAVVSLAFDKIDEQVAEKAETAKASNGNLLIEEVQQLKEQVEQLRKQINETPPSQPKKENKSKDLIKRAKAKRKEGLDEINDFFKKQSGQLNAGIPFDSQLFGGIQKVFESYVLEFRGNTELAFQKLKQALKDSKVNEKDLESIKSKLAEEAQPTIEEVIQNEQIKVVQDFLNKNRKTKKIDEKVNKQRAREIVEEFNANPEKEADILMFAQEAGMITLSTEQRRDIMLKVREISELEAEGQVILAAKKFESLRYELIDQKLEGYDIQDVIYDLWYTNTLSGLTTLRRSTFGSTLTTFMFNVSRMLANPRLAIESAKVFTSPQRWTDAFKIGLNVVRTGDTNVQFRDYKSESPSYFKKVTNTAFSKLNVKDKSVKAIMGPVVYAYRNILAADAMLTNFSNEFNYNVITYNKFVEDGSMKGKDAFAKLLKEKNDTKLSQLRNQAKEEYNALKQSDPQIAKELGTSYPTKRFNELVELTRDIETTEMALNDSKKAAMVSSPEGKLGWMYENWINKTFSPNKNPKTSTDQFGNIAKQVVRLGLFPFMRVFTNYMNMGLEYTPMGFVRGIPKKIEFNGKTYLDNTKRWTVKGDRKVMDYERREMVVRATMGTVLATTIFKSIFDMDDEGELQFTENPIFKINGHMTGVNNWKDEKKIDGKRKPWSIAIRLPNGEYSDYFSYIDNPIGLMLAPIGIIHDNKFYGDFKKESKGYTKEQVDKTIGYYAQAFMTGAWQYSMSQSFNQSFREISNLVNTTASGNENLTEKFIGFISRPSGNLLTPSLYRQLEQQGRAYAQIPEKEASEWYEKAFKNVLFANAVMKDYKYDVFGYPIIRDIDTPFVPDEILKTISDNLDYREGYKEWRLLRKYPQVLVSNFQLPSSYKKNYNVNEEKKTLYIKTAGEAFRSMVNDNYERLDKMDAVQLQNYLNTYQRKARKEAKSKVDLLK